MGSILSLDNVSMRFGGLFAIKDLSFQLNEGEFLGLMGPNGAGKTTLINVISGEMTPTDGAITFLGKNISTLPAFEVCKMGIARTYQIPRPFGKLSVMENVLVSARYGKGLDHKEGKKQAMKCLELVELNDKVALRANQLQFSELRRLELARALAADPKVLLIDEIAAGLSDAELPIMLEILKKIRAQGTTVIIIEHILKILVRVVDRIIVIDQGQKIAEGETDKVMKDEKVIAAYLGNAV